MKLSTHSLAHHPNDRRGGYLLVGHGSGSRYNWGVTGQMACSTAGTSASSQDHCKVQLKLGRTGGLEDLSALACAAAAGCSPGDKPVSTFSCPLRCRTVKLKVVKLQVERRSYRELHCRSAVAASL